MSNTPLHRIRAVRPRPAALAVAAALALALAGCAGPTVAPEEAPPSLARSALKTISFATDAAPPADFVRAQRRPLDSLAYIPISTPQDEPTLKPADKASVEKRAAAAKALKPRRDALAAARPTMRPPPQLPASALEARKEHDERMRERASPAE